MTAPLRKIVGRSFSAQVGTRIALECGHFVLSYSGRRKQQQMRCHECARQPA